MGGKISGERGSRQQVASITGPACGAAKAADDKTARPSVEKNLFRV
jgi:hypothetical protein